MSGDIILLHMYPINEDHMMQGSSHLILRGDLKISDQNNWGTPEQKNKFRGELNIVGKGVIPPPFLRFPPF